MTDKSGLSEISMRSAELEKALRAKFSAKSKSPAARLYQMLEYFLGFRNERLKPKHAYAGKRFRALMCLFLAEEYGVRAQALPAALAIELFHNFSLIHDDIVDRDETRRGRPTVWKLWGADHALNSGDVLSLIASDAAIEAANQSSPEIGHALLRSFMQVGEGQYLDFEISKKPLEKISEQEYFAMIRRKTAALTAVSAEIPGMAAHKGASELRNLRKFGEALGLAYQMADDYRSIWSPGKITGKDTHGDIREKKRTLPVLLLYKALPGGSRKQLRDLYSKKQELSASEMRWIVDAFNHSRVRNEIRRRIESAGKRSKELLHALSISAQAKKALERAIDAFTEVA